MTSPAPFGRMLTAMATAFTDDGAVDLDATAAIARHLVDHGHDGVVVSGTTGESPTTSLAETGDILRVVKDAVGDRATVIAGVGSNDTAHSIDLAQQAEKLGADALLLVTPYYSKPGQAGVLHHFRQVVAATGTPVVLYDVPGRTGTRIDLETYEQIKGETVVAVKDAVGDFARGVRLMDLGYAVYSGDDAANLAWLAHGASGVISVVGHVAGPAIRSMIEDFLDGNTTAALKTYQRLVPATDAIMGVPN
jgi:4-hydroxy-tetrahydrodipicolinate synthase